MNVERIKVADLSLLWITAVFTGATLGATTNIVNGNVSPEYFRTIMGWQEVANVPRAAIAQGIVEGLFIGLVLATVFSSVVGFISHARCTYSFGVRFLGGIVAGAMFCWIIGGMIALGLAVLSPEFFQHAFRGSALTGSDLLKYAWVGGSIDGLELGGAACVVIGCVLFRARWRALLEQINPQR
jgi:hypothetical protein